MGPVGGAEWEPSGTAGADPEGGSRSATPPPALRILPNVGDVPGPCFVGRYVHQLDEKRRIALPKALRDEIDEARDGGAFFLVPGLDLCLSLFTQKRFEAFGKRLREFKDGSAGEGHKNLRALIRDIFSGTTKLTSDKQGRISLPEEACKRVGIEREVVFLGVDEKIELWSPRAEEVRDDPERLLRLGRELIG